MGESRGSRVDMPVSSAHVSRMSLRIVLPLFALFAIGNAGPDPDAPVAGLWESTTSLISFSGPEATPEKVDAVKRMFSTPQVKRECDEQGPVRVGDVRGVCRVTRASEQGPNVEWEMSCTGPNDRYLGRAVTTGTRAPNRTDYRVTSDIHGEKGELLHTLVIREVSVRVGDCPKP